MIQPRKLRADDEIIDIINDDYTILPLLSRFSIPLGVGNETLGQVCGSNNIDVDALLLMLNYIRTGIIDSQTIGKVSPVEVVRFLKNSHDYFIYYKFAHIRKNLIAALDLEPNPSNNLILNFYDTFVKKVREHFNYEEQTVFPYIDTLVAGSHSSYTIDTFRRQHEDVGDALSELKNIILRYYRTTAPNLMYDVLVDIYNCEEDLASHSDIENNLLIPMVSELENKVSE
ncbi:MAG: hemerythrin domain-containing protein [Muribaculaceae bacterium]|nr:hemerythrin domain-containing protein [Muribaculaceae bacterium]